MNILIKIHNYIIYIIADVDECSEGISACSQRCQNIAGGYACSCFDGYSLDEDGRACNGKTWWEIYIVMVYFDHS